MQCSIKRFEKSADWNERPIAMAGNRPRFQGEDDGGVATVGRGTAVITRTKTKTKKPSLYRVLLLNDDYTPMEFVIHVLERFFQKSRDDATRVMLHVHNHGVGECGVYTFEVAGDQGDASHGFRAPAPASAAMRDGKEMRKI